MWVKLNALLVKLNAKHAVTTESESDMTQLTEKEKKAIQALESAAKIWPKTLWLFSASGTLTVMKKDESGHRAMTESKGGSVGGSVDQTFAVGWIDIENDGGDY